LIYYGGQRWVAVTCGNLRQLAATCGDLRHYAAGGNIDIFVLVTLRRTRSKISGLSNKMV